ncbi:MAG: hypothetical protein L0154_20800 [Chloroflexi bacterium]|nr:hypothetical protein [Chloroflexota bacterium]
MQRATCVIILLVALITGCTENKSNTSELKSREQSAVSTITEDISSVETDVLRINLENPPKGQLVFLKDNTLYKLGFDGSDPDILAENVELVDRSPDYNNLLYLTSGVKNEVTILQLNSGTSPITFELDKDEEILDYQWSPNGEWLFLNTIRSTTNQTPGQESLYCRLISVIDDTSLPQVINAIGPIETDNCQGLWLSDNTFLVSMREGNTDYLSIYSKFRDRPDKKAGVCWLNAQWIQ